MAAGTPETSASQPKPTRAPTKLLLFPLPKVVFFYPTMVMALIAAVVTSDVEDSISKGVAYGYLNQDYIAKTSLENVDKSKLGQGSRDDEGRTIPEFDKSASEWRIVTERIGAHDREAGAHPGYGLGWIFLIVFTVNILIISFDFPGVKALAVAFLVLAVTFGGLYLNVQYEILPILAAWFNTVTPYATPHFYWYIAVVLFLIILASVFVNRFWNKWILESNRLVHKHGMLGDVKEWPTLNLQIRKEITDIFEYLLLMSGSLVFIPGGGNERPIVLENIPWIGRKEAKIRRILEQWRVGSND